MHDPLEKDTNDPGTIMGQVQGRTSHLVPPLSPGKLEAQVPRCKVIRPAAKALITIVCPQESEVVSGLRGFLILEYGIRVLSFPHPSPLFCVFFPPSSLRLKLKLPVTKDSLDLRILLHLPLNGGDSRSTPLTLLVFT